MIEEGEVVGLKNKKIIVRLQRKSSCDNCNICGFRKNDAHIDITTENNIHAKIGDRVSMELNSSTVTLASVIVYLVPLVIGLALYLISFLFIEIELVQLLVLIAGVLIGFLVVHFLDKVVKKTSFNPVVREITKEKIIKRGENND